MADEYKYTDVWGDTVSVAAACRGEKVIGIMMADGRDTAVTIPGSEIAKLIVALLGEDWKP